MKSLAALLTVALTCCQCSVGYAATRTATLSVPSMTCAACPITVKKALSRVAGVNNVSVSFTDKQATVSFDDSKTTVDALTKATSDAGYPSTAKDGPAK